MAAGDRSGARIIDIALQAGVSTATVDRVLNNRPGVRAKTIDKVRVALRALESAKQRPKVVPSVSAGIVIDAIIAGDAGFANDRLARELVRVGQDRGIKLRSSYPKRLDPFALAEALRVARRRRGSGLIVQALDHPVVRDAIAETTEAGIPVVAIMTSLPGAPVLGYTGLDNRAAGRSAGLLMGRLIREPGDIAIFLGGTIYRSHEEREIGFRTVLREEFSGLDILTPFQGFDDPERNYRAGREFLKRDSLRGIYSLGSGNRGIEKAVLESGRQAEITYIAFNLTPLTRQALLNGVIDAVIHQDMARQAETAIDGLIAHLTNRPATFPDLPVEIVMRENIR